MKKKIPLAVLEIIQPYLDKKGSTFEIVEPGDSLLRFKDKDCSSDFYFLIKQYKFDKELQLLIDRKPQNNRSINNGEVFINAKQLDGYFTSWVELLNGYDRVKSVYDDPIIEAYTDEFFAEFEIIDEDADIKPLTTKQVFLLDSHLENIENRIEEFQTDSNKEEILQIKNEVIELRNNLTRKSKKIIIKSLSKIWAKMAKQGPVLLKEFLTESKKFVIRQAIKALYEGGIDLIIK